MTARSEADGDSAAVDLPDIDHRHSPRTAATITAAFGAATPYARRIEHLDHAVDDHNRALKQHLDEAAPQLITEQGAGGIGSWHRRRATLG